ncbi:MAG: hypothetical protein H5T86_09205, partial [Armatimonadetes bacterium]|nr:hypothetical protein [Armatimonadota bacterium]
MGDRCKERHIVGRTAGKSPAPIQERWRVGVARLQQSVERSCTAMAEGPIGVGVVGYGKVGEGYHAQLASELDDFHL